MANKSDSDAGCNMNSASSIECFWEDKKKNKHDFQGNKDQDQLLDKKGNKVDLMTWDRYYYPSFINKII